MSLGIEGAEFKMEGPSADGCGCVMRAHLFKTPILFFVDPPHFVLTDPCMRRRPGILSSDPQPFFSTPPVSLFDLPQPFFSTPNLFVRPPGQDTGSRSG